MRGKDVTNPCTAIRLFAMCQAMKWAHLPVAGGIYDQHPQLMDQFMYIFEEKAKWEELERKREKRRSEQDKMKTLRRGR